ncbi:5'-deoxynucleotidase [Atopobium fossor]|uniref:5'-deoxynucleotidase n=1 Tax=Atopobium fossor TaxID=39487 RepID=UPI0004139B41|nr:5'-deoxynucleotidase [Atopobium fossor]
MAQTHNQQQSPFLAILSRMKYINRWALMRNSREENLSEHSLDVALIAHMLVTLANVRHSRTLNADRAAMIALLHDSSEIITGDMPTPVKYANGHIQDAYKDIEVLAEESLIKTLPEDLRGVYADLYHTDCPSEDEQYIRRLVKAADKISALIKCIDEAQAGNAEFATAQKTCQATVDVMAAQLPEVADFVAEFLPSYGSTLDELLSL